MKCILKRTVLGLMENWRLEKLWKVLTLIEPWFLFYHQRQKLCKSMLKGYIKIIQKVSNSGTTVISES
jgi:hypothetical protein